MIQVTSAKQARLSPSHSEIAVYLLLMAFISSCAADAAMGRLRGASPRLWAQPQAVMRPDFPTAELSVSALEKVKSTAPGSQVLRDALVAQAAVRKFVTDHGIPDGVRITNHGLQLELMYVQTSTVYVFALGDLLPADLVGTRELNYVERTAINPENHWQRASNDLRLYLDDASRLLRIGRRLLRAVAPQGLPARDLGFMVVDATPASAKVFGLPEESRGVIVAYVDPDGPSARLLKRGDLLTALADRRLSGIDDYRPEEVQGGGTIPVTRWRAGEQESLAITPEALPFALEIQVIDISEVNAFAVPGLVVVTRAMLNFCDDNELAFVFGHELGHIAERQSGTRKEREAMRKGGIAPGVIAPPEDFSQLQLRLLLASLANWRSESSLSLQEQELLADRHGIEYAVHAGYDPTAAVRFLEVLARREDIRPVVEFIKAHPPAAERLQQARKIIGELPPRSSSSAEGYRSTRQPTLN